MGFRDLNLKYYYNNDEDDLIEEFYNPVLKNAVLYKRATGFFASSSFWAFIEGLRDFLDKDGRMKLLISPKLSKEDIEAIAMGEKAKADSIEGFLISKILEEDRYKDQFNLLAWLIYEEKLDIKIVVKKNFAEYGIFHDKFAIVEDTEGNKIGFHGSLNETEAGLIDNFESINVFQGWNESDYNRIENMNRLFDSVWNNQSGKWVCFDIPESIKKEIIDQRESINFNKKNKEVYIPEKYNLREYQKEAINSWFKNNCKGILEMATGSGKTLTAIFAMIKTINLLKAKGFSCGLVIVVPYRNLLEQWCEELNEFNIVPIRCYENKELWYNKMLIAVSNFNKYENENFFIITTNTTYITEHFQGLLYKIQRNYIFCADEMHHLIGPAISKLLPENTDIRIGLTATLGNEYEEEKIEKLKQYFSNIVFTFNLKDAIENECLTKYYYYPVFVELTDEEMEDYINLTKRIVKLLNLNDDGESLKRVLNERRRVIFNAENKIKQFLLMENELKKYKRTLVYCGDKKDEDGRFINKINRIVYDMGLKTHTYTSELGKKDRERVLDEFKRGDIEVLTAIRCLDEGVNIPALDCAFILSSNMDSKQFIQRRGRILRRAPNKEFAYIYDFIVIPSLDEYIIRHMDLDVKEIQTKIISKELKRVYEFASLCENKVEVLSKIVDVIKLYS